MGRLISAEVRKVLTTRLWIWLLLAATLLTALYAGLNIAFTDSPDNFAPHLSSPEGQRLLVAIAATPATTFAAVLAAVGTTGEFRHRTAATTFLVSPHRWPVIGAKLVVYAVAGAVFAIVCVGVVLAMGRPWLATREITLSLTTSGVPGVVVGVTAAGVAFGMIGVAVGALLREQVATVVGILVYRFVAEPIVSSVPALHDWTIYLPGVAASGLAGSALENREFLAPWLGGVVVFGYVLVLAIAGIVMVRRRDVM